MKNGLRAALVLAVAATALAGCDTIRDAAGMDKSAPDEFAVTTKAPLVIPPDYNLQPPRPGAVPTNQVDPTEAAEGALFGNDPATIAAQLPNTFSETEKMVLANAKVQNIDPQIHQNLASDYKNMVATDDGFTKDILFWQKPKTDEGQPLNADEEAKKIDEKRAGQAPATPGATAKPAAPPKKEDSGWFDGWFDWF
jgi:predicted small secreted protein